MTDEELMRLALAEADMAFALGEVPVGAVVAKDGQPIALAHNTRETEKNAIMRNFWPLTGPARRWAAGGCGSANCS